MTMYRSASGKMVDMDKLRSQQGDTRAVGNMNVNARGDTLDSHNNVTNDSSQRVNKMYRNAMINAGKLPRRVDTPVPQPEAQPSVNPANALQADVGVTNVQSIIQAPPPIIEEPEFSEEELEFDFGDDEEPVGKEPPPETKKKK